jgi:two-component system CAI-1 autoinducer sensor kinase/phosphatase CqsS
VLLLIQSQRQLENDHHSDRIRVLAWIGCVCMPLYYVIWSFWFPQGFESLLLRLIGVGMCLLALRAPTLLEGRYLGAVQFLAATYVLPFFFTFMFLMNHASTVWSQSLLIALIVVFQFDTMWALKSIACGTLLAAAVFFWAGDGAFHASADVLQQLPIYCFTVLVVSCAKIGHRVLAAQKMAGMAQALATVVHELRTPLISVSANARGIERCLVEEQGPSQADREAIRDAIGRVQFEVRHMNHMIELFLMSATALKQQLAPTEQLSMGAVVASVIDSYPFTSQAQRELVSVRIRQDFTFAGKHDLSRVILLNLLRNALTALKRAGRGGVRIIIDGGRARPRLVVIDTGCGIAAQRLPRVFQRFYTYPAGSGSGIGLALCKDIMNAWDGSIHCVSRERAYTAFILEFPKVFPTGASAPGAIARELNHVDAHLSTS